MEPHYSNEAVTLYHGDCREVLAQLPDESVDSVVTDPPYELGFMGKRWDASGIAYDAGLWAECLRVLKPGGHLLAFGGTRTWHRLAVAIEDAGFEIRDSIAWMYGSGFPKSLDVSKALDKSIGENRQRQLQFTAWMRSTGLPQEQCAAIVRRFAKNDATARAMAQHYYSDKQQPAIPTLEIFNEIRQHIPDVPEAIERLVVERTGIEWTAYKKRKVVGERDVPVGHAFAGETYGGDSSNKVVDITAPATPDAARWQGWGTALKPAHEPIVVARKPLIGTVAANVLEHGTGGLNIDGCRIGFASDSDRASAQALADLRAKGRRLGVLGEPGQGASLAVSEAGDTRTGHEDVTTHTAGRWPANVVLDEDQAAALDEQSARFFYVAKAPAKERPKVDGVAHPTVKPLTLMRWLCRLVTPPGGVILEPFAGSGTTVQAAVAEGFRCIAIEREDDYLPLILSRLTPEESDDDGQLTLDTPA